MAITRQSYTRLVTSVYTHKVSIHTASRVAIFFTEFSEAVNANTDGISNTGFRHITLNFVGLGFRVMVRVSRVMVRVRVS